MAAAILYALNRWQALMRYCDDGQIEIDNNAAERTLRTVAPSRKNDLFAGADTGGERVAAIYSRGGADCSFQGEPRQPGGVGINDACYRSVK